MADENLREVKVQFLYQDDAEAAPEMSLKVQEGAVPNVMVSGRYGSSNYGAGGPMDDLLIVRFQGFVVPEAASKKHQAEVEKEEKEAEAAAKEADQEASKTAKK